MVKNLQGTRPFESRITNYLIRERFLKSNYPSKSGNKGLNNVCPGLGLGHGHIRFGKANEFHILLRMRRIENRK